MCSTCLTNFFFATFLGDDQLAVLALGACRPFAVKVPQ